MRDTPTAETCRQRQRKEQESELSGPLLFDVLLPVAVFFPPAQANAPSSRMPTRKKTKLMTSSQTELNTGQLQIRKTKRRRRESERAAALTRDKRETRQPWINEAASASLLAVIGPDSGTRRFPFWQVRFRRFSPANERTPFRGDHFRRCRPSPSARDRSRRESPHCASIHPNDLY